MSVALSHPRDALSRTLHAMGTGAARLVPSAIAVSHLNWTASVALFGVLARAVFVLSLGDRWYDAGVLSLLPTVESLLKGHVPEEGLGPTPVVTLLLTLGRWWAADHFRIAARMLLLLFAVGTLGVSASLARRIAGPSLARRALPLLAFSPLLVLASGSFSVPGVAACLIAVTAIATRSFVNTPGPGRGFAVSALVALTWFANALSGYSLAALAAWGAIRLIGSRRRLSAGVMLLLCGACLVASVKPSGTSLAEWRAGQETRLASSGDEGEVGEVAAVAARDSRGLRMKPARTSPGQRLVEFVVPASLGQSAMHPLQRRATLLLGLFYFLPLVVAAGFGLARGRAAAGDRWLLASLIAGALLTAVTLGASLESRVLAAPFLLVAAALGLDRLLPPLPTEAGARRAASRAAGASFLVGAALLTVTAAGLHVPLRNPELYSLPEAAGWSRLRFTERHVRAVAASDRSDVKAYVTRLNEAVHFGLQHYWDERGASRFSLHVPLHENFILNMLGWIAPSRFGMYEFLDHRRALARGAGICSQHAIVEAGLLQDAKIPARIVRLGGHVVLEALVDARAGTWWVFDPDFGVVLPHSMKELEADGERVRAAYRAAGYSDAVAAELAVDYAPERNMAFEDANEFAGPRRAWAERAAYLMIWVLPLLAMFPYLLANWRVRSDTAPVR